MSHEDPAYRYEEEKMAEYCRAYLAAFEAGDAFETMLLIGSITGQCARIYRMSPPGGLVDVPALFRREEPDESS